MIIEQVYRKMDLFFSLLARHISANILDANNNADNNNDNNN